MLLFNQKYFEPCHPEKCQREMVKENVLFFFRSSEHITIQKDNGNGECLTLLRLLLRSLTVFAFVFRGPRFQLINTLIEDRKII